MSNALRLATHKLSRLRQLATLRHLRWLFLSRFRRGIPLRTSILEDVVIEYSPQGNVSRDVYLGLFEKDVMDFFSHYLKPGMVVLDVGANIGIYSLLSAKLVGESGAVHAFEPTPHTFAQLCANAKLNGFNRTHLNNAALSDAPGTSALYLYEQNAMNSLVRQDWVGRPIGSIQVQTMTLDDYVRSQGLTRVDLLKVDVEGAELPVLRGARALLSRPDAPVVVCEFAEKTTRNFGYDPASIRKHLNTLDYACFRWNPRTASLVPERELAEYRLYANLICIKASMTYQAAPKTWRHTQ